MFSVSTFNGRHTKYRLRSDRRSYFRHQIFFVLLPTTGILSYHRLLRSKRPIGSHYGWLRLQTQYLGSQPYETNCGLAFAHSGTVSPDGQMGCRYVAILLAGVTAFMICRGIIAIAAPSRSPT
ncbi:hypothetical protein B0H14DRAFT_710951 [Mycena olivaceomarginata]|nr:hypothetical protein B0H14DRAFT_710951 [Mycena olivaceomarginata]